MARRINLGWVHNLGLEFAQPQISTSETLGPLVGASSGMHQAHQNGGMWRSWVAAPKMNVCHGIPGAARSQTSYIKAGLRHLR